MVRYLTGTTRLRQAPLALLHQLRGHGTQGGIRVVIGGKEGAAIAGGPLNAPDGAMPRRAASPAQHALLLLAHDFLRLFRSAISLARVSRGSLVVSCSPVSSYAHIGVLAGPCPPVPAARQARPVDREASLGQFLPAVDTMRQAGLIPFSAIWAFHPPSAPSAVGFVGNFAAALPYSCPARRVLQAGSPGRACSRPTRLRLTCGFFPRQLRLSPFLPPHVPGGGHIHFTASPLPFLYVRPHRYSCHSSIKQSSSSATVISSSSSPGLSPARRHRRIQRPRPHNRIRWARARRRARSSRSGA